MIESVRYSAFEHVILEGDFANLWDEARFDLTVAAHLDSQLTSPARSIEFGRSTQCEQDLEADESEAKRMAQQREGRFAHRHTTHHLVQTT